MQNAKCKKFLKKVYPERSRRAISLYELVIVMSIIGIVTAITIPSIKNYSPWWQLNTSARAVLINLHQAQEDAVTTQDRYLIRFDKSATPPNLWFIKINDDSSETLIETIALEENVTLTLDASISDDEVIFSPDGGPSSSGNIVVTLGESSKTISISPAGVIKLESN